MPLHAVKAGASGDLAGRVLRVVRARRSATQFAVDQTRATVRFCLTTIGAYVTIAPSNELTKDIYRAGALADRNFPGEKSAHLFHAKVVHHDRLASPMALAASMSLSREPVGRVLRILQPRMDSRFKSISWSHASG